MDNKKITYYAGYARVSRKKIQIDNLDTQIAKIADYAQQHNLVCCGNFTDIISGVIAERTGLSEMFQCLEDAKRSGNPITSILVSNMSRFSRSLTVYGHLLYKLEEYVIDIVPIDNPDANDLEKWNLVFKAELERKENSRMVRMKKQEKKLDGYYQGHQMFGYEFCDGVLQIKESEAQVIKKMFSMFNDGASYTSIREEIPILGSIITIKKRLANPIYCGYLRFNNEQILGKHQPIIDRSTYTHTLERLTNYTKLMRYKTSIKSDSNDFVDGVIHCSKCKTLLRIVREKKGNRNYEFLGCKHQHIRIKIEEFLPDLAEAISNIPINTELYSEMLEALIHEYFNKVHLTMIAIDASTKLLSEHQTVLKAITETIHLSNNVIDLYKSRLSVGEAEAKLNAHQAQLKLIGEEFKEALSDIGYPNWSAFSSTPDNEKQMFLKDIFQSNVFYNGQEFLLDETFLAYPLGSNAIDRAQQALFESKSEVADKYIYILDSFKGTPNQ